ncbi:hypothetical protein [Deinococcus phoenicis]|uniref:hypothetical protein n=1 Tax=Deinococcus phoenicis TaxID=1476583 RepID=UPI0004B0C05B|nr:hypothetical protein [Deinococcus phoenicis]
MAVLAFVVGDGAQDVGGEGGPEAEGDLRADAGVALDLAALVQGEGAAWAPARASHG